MPNVIFWFVREFAHQRMLSGLLTFVRATGTIPIGWESGKGRGKIGFKILPRLQFIFLFLPSSFFFVAWDSSTPVAIACLAIVSLIFSCLSYFAAMKEEPSGQSKLTTMFAAVTKDHQFFLLSAEDNVLLTLSDDTGNRRSSWPRWATSS